MTTPSPRVGTTYAPPIPSSGQHPPSIQQAAAVVRAKACELQDAIHMLIGDFSAETGLQVVSIDIGHQTRTWRNPFTKLWSTAHDYSLNVRVRFTPSSSVES